MCVEGCRQNLANLSEDVDANLVLNLMPTNATIEWAIISTVDEDREANRILDVVASLFVGFFLAVIIFLSVAGNLLVCIAVYTDRTLRKVGNLFIVSLAISDLFVACLVMVFAVANDLQGYWIFGDQFCDIWVAFDVMCCTASILNLCAISMDRYIHIKDPLRYGRWMSKRVIYSSIAAIWLLAALISFLPISMDLHKPEHQHQLTATTTAESSSLTSGPSAQSSWSADGDVMSLAGGGVSRGEYYDLTYQLPQCALDLTPTYAVVSSCISFYFPCIVMLAIYSRLFFYAKMHVQNIKATTRPVTLGRFEGEANNLTVNDAEVGGNSRRHSPPYHVSDHKAAITLGIIMGVFLICWVPFFCVNIVAAFCKTCIPPIVFKVLTWLGYSNSAFNPIIYSIFNLEFREAFHKILTTRCNALFCCGRRCYDRFEHAGVRNGSSQIHMDHLTRTGANGAIVNSFSRPSSRRHSSECSASPSRHSTTPRQGSGQHLLIVEKPV